MTDDRIVLPPFGTIAGMREAVGVIVAAIADGRLTPEQGEAIVACVRTARHMMEQELELQLQRLECRMEANERW